MVKSEDMALRARELVRYYEQHCEEQWYEMVVDVLEREFNLTREQADDVALDAT